MARVLSIFQLTALIAVLIALVFATTAARAQEAEVTTTEAETAPADEVGVPQEGEVIAPPNVLEGLTTAADQTFPVVADNVTSGTAPSVLPSTEASTTSALPTTATSTKAPKPTCGFFSCHQNAAPSASTAIQTASVALALAAIAIMF